MTDIGQIFTLIGVALGAMATFTVNALNERIRYRRELRVRWDSHKLEAYVAYLSSVTQMARAAGQAAGLRGYDDLAAPIDEDKALPALDAAEFERTATFERIVLLGDRETVHMGHTLNRTIWRLEWLARGLSDGSPEEWSRARDDFVATLGDFHDCARHNLDVSGEFLKDRTVEEPGRQDGGPRAQ